VIYVGRGERVCINCRFYEQYYRRRCVGEYTQLPDCTGFCHLFGKEQSPLDPLCRELAEQRLRDATEAERLASIAADTSKIIRQAMKEEIMGKELSHGACCEILNFLRARRAEQAGLTLPGLRAFLPDEMGLTDEETAVEILAVECDNDLWRACVQLPVGTRRTGTCPGSYRGAIRVACGASEGQGAAS